MFPLLLIVITCLLQKSDAAQWTHNQIIAAGFDPKTQGYINCSMSEFQKILYIVEGKYGFECYRQDYGTMEMKFSRCVLYRNDTHCTAISDIDIGRIIQGQLYEEDHDYILRMIDACRRITEKLAVVTEANIIPVTDAWNLWIGEYPNGVYDVKAKINRGNLVKFQYSASNFPHSPAWDWPLSDQLRIGCDPTGQSFISSTYHLHGAEVYGCIDGLSKRHFFGCAQVLIGRKDTVSSDDTFTYIFVFKNTVEEEMRELRRLYAYAAFKSRKRPMVNDVKQLTHMQLCARIASEIEYGVFDNASLHPYLAREQSLKGITVQPLYTL